MCKFVRDKADDVISDACAKIGGELESTPKTRGGGQLGKDGFTARGKSNESRAATGIPGTTRDRFKKLAQNKAKLPVLRKRLRDQGKEATVNEKRKSALEKLLRHPHPGIASNSHYIVDGATVFQNACKLGCEGVVSKRLGSSYRSGRSAHWLKVKNPAAPAVTREAEEDWGR